MKRRANCDPISIFAFFCFFLLFFFFFFFPLGSWRLQRVRNNDHHNHHSHLCASITAIRHTGYPDQSPVEKARHKPLLFYLYLYYIIYFSQF
jgi:hypothetical protein